MLQVAYGHSCDIDAHEAVEELVTQCNQSLGDLKPQAGLLLSEIDADHQVLLDGLSRAYPGLELIGCTTDGEFSSLAEQQEGSNLLILFASETVKIRAGLGRALSKDPEKATREAVDEATQNLPSKPKLCLMTPDSLTTSGVAILQGLKKVLGKNFPILGGSAGDSSEFQRTYQFYKSQVVQDTIPLLLFSGDLVFSHGVASGWKPIGKKSIITEAKANQAYRIGEKSALSFYRHYLGPNSVPLGENPLAIFESSESPHFYLRSPFDFSEEDGSVKFFGDLPLQTTVQLTETTRGEILNAAEASARQALAQYKGNRPSMAFCISCAGRKHLLGSQAKKELTTLQKVFPKELPLCGFYAYSEFGPLASHHQSQFHNTTFITLLLGS